MINARAETLAEKPAFRGLLGNRRCLVPADGFYEWRKGGKRKGPMRFKLKSGEPFAFAGLWDSWKQPDGSSLCTYTIVTTEPHDVLRPIHDRMPAILSNDDAQKWLAVDDEIAHALTAKPPCMMERYKGYWITGSAVPGPPYTRYWETLGTVLKDGRSGSIVNVSKNLAFQAQGHSPLQLWLIVNGTPGPKVKPVALAFIQSALQTPWSDRLDIL